MKKLVYLFFSLIAFISCNKNDDNQIGEVFNANFIYLKFSDAQGNDLFQTNVYKQDKLSVFVTDENWNDLYYTSGHRNGQKMENVEGYAKVRSIDYVDNRTILGLLLVYEHEVENNLVTSYYKLQYDDNMFDYIKVVAEKGERFFYIRKVYYNEVEYTLEEDSTPIINIIK
ncbi:hypothetical protein AB4865_01140 [Capnocytophaga sp. ARDL2]|uniref:hypothetical protein n=1 Tax=Capnocytophaga sp. ARDL2 TaxID=3238809 RepID=UPI003556132A